MDIKSMQKKEKARLLKVFRSIDSNKLKTAMPLIDRAAFITASLCDLEEGLAVNGWTEKYMNGQGQFGVKRSASADCHISLTKNLNAIIKQLLELTPPAERSESKLKVLLRE